MKNTFSENLRKFRLEQGLKQIDLAKRLSTTQRRISYWESGKIEPDMNSLWELADFFDISIDELIGREEL